MIARDSGETTLWPGLPVGEVIRRYEEEYGASADGGFGAAEAPPQRIDLEATSFLLTPPEWLQEAADARSAAEQRGAGAGSAQAPAAAPAPAPGPASSVSDAWAEVSVNDTDGAAVQSSAGVAETGPGAGVGPSGVPTPWAEADTTDGAGGEDRSVELPATVFAPPLAGFDEEDDASTPPRVRPDAKTELLQGGSQLPRTQMAPAVEEADGSRPMRRSAAAADAVRTAARRGAAGSAAAVGAAGHRCAAPAGCRDARRGRAGCAAFRRRWGACRGDDAGRRLGASW